MVCCIDGFDMLSPSFNTVCKFSPQIICIQIILNLKYNLDSVFIITLESYNTSYKLRCLQKYITMLLKRYPRERNALSTSRSSRLETDKATTVYLNQDE